MFGPHLTLDLYYCNKEKLNDENFIREILNRLPEILGLHKLSEPIIDYYEEPTPGISGFVIISESHISIHTFINKQFTSVDIFSCREFDVEKATGFLTKVLEAKAVERNLIMRGTHYPTDMKKSILRVIKERDKITTS